MTKKKELTITVGCDPEYFYQSFDKEFKYPYGVPGSKAAPFIVKDGAIQIDGLALELNIIPALTEEEFVNRCKSVFQEFGKYVIQKNIKIVSTADFQPKYLNSLNPSVVELGCIPDFNAYTGEANPRPNFGKDDALQTMRTAAGHIHAGWEPVDVNIRDPNHIANCYEVVKQLDYYVGVPSMFWDRDNRRRQLYGKAGACRIKPYGVEYRTPSNQWFTDERLMKFVFNNTVKAIKDLYAGRSAHSKYAHRAQEVIDLGIMPDLSWAGQFCEGLPNEYITGEFLKQKKA